MDPLIRSQKYHLSSSSSSSNTQRCYIGCLIHFHSVHLMLILLLAAAAVAATATTRCRWGYTIKTAVPFGNNKRANHSPFSFGRLSSARLLYFAHAHHFSQNHFSPWYIYFCLRWAVCLFFSVPECRRNNVFFVSIIRTPFEKWEELTGPERKKNPQKIEHTTSASIGNQ